MSTIAVIVQSDSNGYGASVRYDGYPSHACAALCEIIQRDGVEEALRVLCDEFWDWCCIDSQQAVEPVSDGQIAIEGYGIAYEKEYGLKQQHYRDFDVDWAYLVDGDGLIAVYQEGAPFGNVDAFSDNYLNEIADFVYE